MMIYMYLPLRHREDVGADRICSNVNIDIIIAYEQLLRQRIDAICMLQID